MQIRSYAQGYAWTFFSFIFTITVSGGLWLGVWKIGGSFTLGVLAGIVGALVAGAVTAILLILSVYTHVNMRYVEYDDETPESDTAQK